MKAEMRDAGERIVVGHHLSDAIPGAPDTQSVAFNGLTGTVGIAEYIFSNGVDYSTSIAADGDLKHEMGHAFDQAVAVASGQAASQVRVLDRPLAKCLQGGAGASLMDCVAPALLVAQAIGRVGNYFNQEQHMRCR